MSYHLQNVLDLKCVDRRQRSELYHGQVALEE